MFISLINFPIKWHPLPAADLGRHNIIKNGQDAIGEEQVMEGKLAQERYRAKRRRFSVFTGTATFRIQFYSTI